MKAYLWVVRTVLDGVGLVSGVVADRADVDEQGRADNPEGDNQYK